MSLELTFLTMYSAYKCFVIVVQCKWYIVESTSSQRCIKYYRPKFTQDALLFFTNFLHQLCVNFQIIHHQKSVGVISEEIQLGLIFGPTS